MNIGESPSRVFIPIFKLCTGKGCVLTLRLFYLTHSIKVRFTTELLISNNNKGGLRRKLICRKSTFNTLLCKRSVGGQCLRSHQKVPLQINSHKTKCHICLLDIRKQPNGCFTSKFIWFNMQTLRFSSADFTRKKKPNETRIQVSIVNSNSTVSNAPATFMANTRLFYQIHNYLHSSCSLWNILFKVCNFRRMI